MASTEERSFCKICNKEKRTVRCDGCLQSFCYAHLTDHRQGLNIQLDLIESNCDLFRQTLNDHTSNPQMSSMMQKVNQWEKESMDKIQQTADECRRLITEHLDKNIHEIEAEFRKFADRVKYIRKEDDFNEIDLNEFDTKLKQLQQQLHQPSMFSIQQNSTSLINKIQIVTSSEAKHQIKSKNIAVQVKTPLAAPLWYQPFQVSNVRRTDSNYPECKTSTTQYSVEDCVDDPRTENKDNDINLETCPMCYWQFPPSMSMPAKHEHIESHF
ncbi:unnamed protein product [Adineta ricciae]|uniref:B box-type domain-containing protein n=1 Tax=Adineta ricciae TaxID=249248 RepID=A0A815T914_ADIRI|nr:unnamed protein product [Adineta ricciae]CAF1501701.1 unnamed protein product [Adineta ricciae]